MRKTPVTKLAEIKRQWQLIDLRGQVLGRTASQIAQLLMGKSKPNLSPHLDGGDYVVAINAKEVKVTGRKESQKIYWRHSGYPGGERTRTLTEQRMRDARKIIELAVAGMLPKNKLRRQRLARLKVFEGSEHNYGDKFK